MQAELGAEGYKAAFLEMLEKAREEDLDITMEEKPVQKSGNGTTISGNRIIAQKQNGLYAVRYHPVGGVPRPEKFAELYAAVEPMEDVELRIGPDEEIYIINLTGEEAEKILEVTSDSARNMFETSVACIGSTVCQIGLRDSQGALKAVLDEVEKYHFGEGVLPRIHISGCPSSCGTHQIGTLGFHGGVKRIDGAAEPAFTLHVNGSDTEGKERFGEQWGMMLQKDMPAFFAELGQAVEAEQTTYEKWFASDPEKLRKIAEKYLH